MATLFKSRAGGGNVSVLLMIATVLAVGGFFYWLSRNAVPTEGAPEESAAEPGVDSAAVVAPEDFAAGTEDYVGQAVTLQGVRVTQLFGPRAFWFALADSLSTFYLVHLSEQAAADSVPMAAGSVFDVSGTVTPMTDSVLDAWEAAGYFVQENDRYLAEYAIDFFEAGRVVESDGSGPAG